MVYNGYTYGMPMSVVNMLWETGLRQYFDWSGTYFQISIVNIRWETRLRQYFDWSGIFLEDMAIGEDAGSPCHEEADTYVPRGSGEAMQTIPCGGG
eukprot:661038-Karenia_brevis.AAC.1